MIRHNLRSLHEVCEFCLSLSDGVVNTKRLIRDILIDNKSYVLSLKDKSVMVILDRVSEDIAELHVYAVKEARGKRLVAFIEEVRVFLKDNTDIKTVLNATKDRKVKLLMGVFGSKRVGEHDGFTIYRSEVIR